MTDRELANKIMRRIDMLTEGNRKHKFTLLDGVKIAYLVEAIITELREHGMLKQG